MQSSCDSAAGALNMQRHTRQRVAIESALRDSGRPLSPAEILQVARAAVPSLNLATVYRTLKRLGQAGAVAMIEMSGEAPHYRLRQEEAHHHHHFRCNKCRGVFCMEGCVDGLKKLLPRGFQMTGHDIVLYGLCSQCGGHARKSDAR